MQHHFQPQDLQNLPFPVYLAGSWCGARRSPAYLYAHHLQSMMHKLTQVHVLFVLLRVSAFLLQYPFTLCNGIEWE